MPISARIVTLPLFITNLNVSRFVFWGCPKCTVPHIPGMGLFEDVKEMAAVAKTQINEAIYTATRVTLPRGLSSVLS